ncbi:MAG TPA: HEAT repeat domain-containing protein [Vicinamibacteria bacterium]
MALSRLPWIAALAAALVLLPAASPPPGPEERLAVELRRLYGAEARPGERWRRSVVRLPDGREVPREQAWRDDPAFTAAASRLLASAAGDDAPLGAWLLGTLPDERRRAGEPLLAEALAHPDPRAAFEAAQALAASGTEASLEALARAARGSPWADVRTAAGWARDEVRRRAGEARDRARASATAPRAEGEIALAPGFRRGVSWWMSEGRTDSGAASFRRLASLGVTWVSIHTWDPLQRGLDNPVFATPDRHVGFRDLGALVRSAHGAGLRVMVKPHLEMRGFEATEEERRVLRGPDSPERRALVARVESQMATGEHLQHNRIAMRTDADWRRWFESYAGYILPYAREAEAAGADMFSVGREMDSTVVLREADWRALVSRIREEFRGPLTYSANFDTWQGIGFWDALDFIGVSAYFPLSDRPDPPLAELEAGWDRALAPLEEASRRWGRPVLLTEAGFPSIPSAARAPWREARTRADVWLQARCYEATLRALARRPAIEGVYFWLWERSSPPPFRDPSHAIVGKPAAFTMARWFSRAGP